MFRYILCGVLNKIRHYSDYKYGCLCDEETNMLH